MALTFLDTQFLGVFGQVLFRHAEIVSGGYKLGLRGTIGATDEEKLKDALETMRRQLRRLSELEDYISSHQKDGSPCEPEPDDDFGGD